MWDFHNLALVTNAAAEFADFLLDERLFENFDHCAFKMFFVAFCNQSLDQNNFFFRVE